MNKHFPSNSLSKGSIEQEYIKKNNAKKTTMQKNLVFGIFNNNIYFSTESPKEPTIYDLLFLFVIS